MSADQLRNFLLVCSRLLNHLALHVIDLVDLLLHRLLAELQDAHSFGEYLILHSLEQAVLGYCRLVSFRLLPLYHARMLGQNENNFFELL